MCDEVSGDRVLDQTSEKHNEIKYLKKLRSQKTGRSDKSKGDRRKSDIERAESFNQNAIGGNKHRLILPAIQKNRSLQQNTNDYHDSPS